MTDPTNTPVMVPCLQASGSCVHLMNTLWCHSRRPRANIAQTHRSNKNHTAKSLLLGLVDRTISGLRGSAQARRAHAGFMRSILEKLAGGCAVRSRAFSNLCACKQPQVLRVKFACHLLGRFTIMTVHRHDFFTLIYFQKANLNTTIADWLPLLALRAVRAS